MKNNRLIRIAKSEIEMKREDAFQSAKAKTRAAYAFLCEHKNAWAEVHHRLFLELLTGIEEQITRCETLREIEKEL